MDLETSNNTEGNITDKQKRQLKCINRRCVHGDTLVSAIQIVCTYYHIEYKPGKMVINLFLHKLDLKVIVDQLM